MVFVPYKQMTRPQIALLREVARGESTHYYGPHHVRVANRLLGWKLLGLTAEDRLEVTERGRGILAILDSAGGPIRRRGGGD